MGSVFFTACSYCLGEGQHRRIALGMVHNRNKSAIGTCIPDIIGIMFFRDMPQQVSFIISEVSFAQTFFPLLPSNKSLDLGAVSFVTMKRENIA